MARPPSDIEARIVDAARARFLSQGVDGASLRSIAHDAGTSIGMVYYYFKTKDDLFLAVVEAVYAQVLSDLGSELAGDAPPEQRIRAVYERIARLDEREFDVVRLIMREALISSVRLGKLASRFQRGHIPLVLAALQEGTASGRISAELPLPMLVVCAIALGMLPQVAHRLVTQAGLPLAPLLPSHGDVARMAAEVLLHGIAGPALRPAQAPPKSTRTPSERG